MKYMIISDIHGDIYNLDIVLKIYYKEQCEKLIILGDLFSYDIYTNRVDIINKLNFFKDNIICVRGNCDTNINGLLFDIKDYKTLRFGFKKVLFTHGHLLSHEELLKRKEKIIFVGHTHIHNIEKIDNKYIINPGSISKSRSGDNSFIIIDNHNITIRNLNNEIIDKCKI